MRLILCLMVALLLAGCAVQGPGASQRFIMDVRVVGAFGYAYNGESGNLNVQVNPGQNPGSGAMMRPEGRLRVNLNADDDVGLVSLLVHGGEKCDGFRWEKFGGSLSFQQGGIARGVTLHGTTANDDPDYPEVEARLAAWGTATVFAHGLEWDRLPENVSEWDAHLMWLEGGIRDIVKVRNGEGGAYNPRDPENAGHASGEDEVHVRLVNRGPNGTGHEIYRINQVIPIVEVDDTQVFSLPHFDAADGDARFHFDLDPGPAAPTAGLRAVVTQGETREVAVLELDNSRRSGDIVFTKERGATYELHVVANGIQGSYRVTGGVHVPHLVISFWGEDIRHLTAEPNGGWVPDESSCG